MKARRKIRVSKPCNEGYESPTKGDKGIINWRCWGAFEVKKILRELAGQFETPSVRGVWYILVSKFPKVIPNTRSIYSSFDKAMVNCRERKKGYPIISEDAFSDDTRIILDIGPDHYVSAEIVADIKINEVKDARKNYTIPRWYMQKNYCEFWVEKRAITRMFVTILRNGDYDRQVRIVPNNGWSSFTYTKNNFERLFEHWQAKYKELNSKLGDKSTYPHIWVFYSGDCDPSGRRMDINLSKEIMHAFRGRLKYHVDREAYFDQHPHLRIGELSRRMTTIHFMRAAVTVKQIAEFDLEGLTDPSPEVELKLEGGYDEKKGRSKKGDPNVEWFKRMFRWYGKNKVFQVELDAMYARREQFKTFLLDLIDSRFDNDIFNKHVIEKGQTEQDLLTLRLKDKLINEDIELPDWPYVERKVKKYKDMMLEFAAQTFNLDWMLLALLSDIRKGGQRNS